MLDLTADITELREKAARLRLAAADSGIHPWQRQPLRDAAADCEAAASRIRAAMAATKPAEAR